MEDNRNQSSIKNEINGSGSLKNNNLTPTQILLSKYGLLSLGNYRIKVKNKEEVVEEDKNENIEYADYEDQEYFDDVYMTRYNLGDIIEINLQKCVEDLENDVNKKTDYTKTQKDHSIIIKLLALAGNSGGELDESGERVFAGAKTRQCFALTAKSVLINRSIYDFIMSYNHSEFDDDNYGIDDFFIFNSMARGRLGMLTDILQQVDEILKNNKNNIDDILIKQELKNFISVAIENYTSGEWCDFDGEEEDLFNNKLCSFISKCLSIIPKTKNTTIHNNNKTLYDDNAEVENEVLIQKKNMTKLEYNLKIVKEFCAERPILAEIKNILQKYEDDGFYVKKILQDLKTYFEEEHARQTQTKSHSMLFAGFYNSFKATLLHSYNEMKHMEDLLLEFGFKAFKSIQEKQHQNNSGNIKDEKDEILNATYTKLSQFNSALNKEEGIFNAKLENALDGNKIQNQINIKRKSQNDIEEELEVEDKKVKKNEDKNEDKNKSPSR